MAMMQNKPKKELKISKRGTNDLKKVMIYGNDGTGKSTFAEKYCKDNHLKPIVIDIDDTNYTNLDIVELDYGTDLSTYKEIKDFCESIKDYDYDTIIIDGVTSLLENLVSNAKGMAKYSDRAGRWNGILRSLLKTKKHLIFIGQADMEVIYTVDAQSPKAVIKVNSMVNEKYYCYIDKNGNYQVETKKYRVKK